jgi:hypothetical protein
MGAMFRSIQTLGLALCTTAFTASSALAANWVQDPSDVAGFTWIDMETIEVREGLTHYTAGYSWSKGTPPAENSDLLKEAINCTTGEYLRWFQDIDRWVNKREGYGPHHGDPSYDQAGALRALICK